MGHPNWKRLAELGQLPDWKKKELGLSGEVNPEAVPVAEALINKERKRGKYPINKFKKHKS